MRVANESSLKAEDYRTRRQWILAGRLPIPDDNGECMYTNHFYNRTAIYWPISRTFVPSDAQLYEARESIRVAERARRQKKKSEKQKRILQEKEREYRYMSAKAAKIQTYLEISKEKIICLDIETTGLDPQKDEILQLGIINGFGEVLFNQFFRPKHIDSWPEAELVNGISPESVANCPTIDDFLPEIQRIIQDADLIVGYNINEFDFRFLLECGIELSALYSCDMMQEFAPIYGEWNPDRQQFRFKSLSTCADYYGYVGTEAYHDALEDSRATLFCFFAMIEDEKSKQCM